MGKSLAGLINLVVIPGTWQYQAEPCRDENLMFVMFLITVTVLTFAFAANGIRPVF